jgi:hypothetical protein
MRQPLFLVADPQAEQMLALCAVDQDRVVMRFDAFHFAHGTDMTALSRERSRVRAHERR